MSTLVIATCMTHEVVTVPPEADVAQGMRQLLAGLYGCVPVLAGGQLVGIVTAIDGLRGFLMDRLLPTGVLDIPDVIRSTRSS